jgi:lipopolysaccharide transport system permease protein
MCGLLPWLAVQEGIFRSATAITDNAALVGKVSFPSELLPLSAVLTAALHQGIAMLLLLFALAVLGELSPGGLPLLLVALPLQLVVTSGLALLVASLQVFFRDTVQLLGMILQAWFYLTPIVYPQALVPAGLQAVLAMNPLATLVALYRQALLGSAAVGVERFAGLAAFAVVALALGWALFTRLRPTFADEV